MDNKIRNGNLYTFLYAAAIVIVVAAILALTAQVLRPRQESNVRTETRLYILRSAGLAGGAYTVKDRNAYVEKEYNRYIKDTAVGPDGLPLFVCTLEDGSKKYIIPLHGTGLWGPIWGYLALDNDFETVYGAVFDHKGETPGLGAEISKEPFSGPFRGKSLYKEGEFVSVSVVKGGKAAGNPNAVDGISGGTITSRAVETMIRECVIKYIPFLKHE